MTDEADRARTVVETEAALVVDKPALVLTVPSRLGPRDRRPCLGRRLEDRLGRRLFPVHRLDFEVSGLVLFAKTPEAHRAASRAFEGRAARKVYEALAEGADRAPALPAAFRWRSPLVRGKKRSFVARHGKIAVTAATALGRLPAEAFCGPGVAGEVLRFRLEPETGRPHQLRVHLAGAGFPIVGDALYGSRLPFHRPGIALRAVELEILDAAARAALGLERPLRVEGFAGA
jgi:tRNA pseudouridine32 synthase/23S rRNA pseudouridine746 synthase